MEIGHDITVLDSITESLFVYVGRRNRLTSMPPYQQKKASSYYGSSREKNFGNLCTPLC